jgi:hypothetical protein
MNSGKALEAVSMLHILVGGMELAQLGAKAKIGPAFKISGEWQW